MSFLRRFELLESSVWGPRSSLLFLSPLEAVDMECDEQIGYALDILSSGANPKMSRFDHHPLLFDCFDSWEVDLVSISASTFAAASRRQETELQLQSLGDRVTALELGLKKEVGARIEGCDRKYKWTAEIKAPRDKESDRKYRLVAEAKADGGRSFKWTKEVKGKGSYSFEASTEPAKVDGVKEKNDEKGKKESKKKKGADTSARLVEIEEEQNPGAIVIRKAFSKRALVGIKGKRKKLSPQDAAVLIQMSFRAFLVRRSQVVRGLRDLAIAKAKLKEIRTLFYNLSYRRRLAREAEEHQRFTEKIIVLLLTVEAIQGPDYLVRSSKKSIIDELEVMLEVVDPQPSGKFSSVKRRKFDLPNNGLFSREMSRSVADVVELIEEDNASDTAAARASA
ncbi:BAG family molecular chaperone regulator 7 [Apostasia shenzhenica]|uniref:BAG family molecular chaperone regulator 7 n=1 Tax=Apostasia shenzhenica TaxID=1088818 RepID=A0A2I0BET9_9ASPA|nr:BAG family molecular chaperone regulator 7 [Apostasia shenzhenica]